MKTRSGHRIANNKEIILYWYYFLQKYFPDILSNKNLSALYIGLKNVHIQNFGPIDENLELQEIIELLLYIPRIYYGRDYRKQLPKLKSNLFIRIEDKRSGTLHPFNESSLYKQVEMKNRKAPGIIKNESMKVKNLRLTEESFAICYVFVEKWARENAPTEVEKLKELDSILLKRKDEYA